MHWTAVFQADVLPPPRGLQWVNPIWWFSDQENATLTWWASARRNFAANLFSVVVGVASSKRWWISTMGGENFPDRGWGFAWVVADGRLAPRPWLCWRGASHEFGAGWKSHGGFGVNWRRARSGNAAGVSR